MINKPPWPRWKHLGGGIYRRRGVLDMVSDFFVSCGIVVTVLAFFALVIFGVLLIIYGVRS